MVRPYPATDEPTPPSGDVGGRAPVLRFGPQPGSDVYAERVVTQAHGTQCGLVTLAGGELDLPVPGLHNLRNALAAIVCGLAAGAPRIPASRRWPVSRRRRAHAASANE